MPRRALAVRVLVLLASAIATAAVLAGQQVVVVTRDGEIRGRQLWRSVRRNTVHAFALPQ